MAVPSIPVTGISFGEPQRYNRPGRTVNGDTWSCAWADDGRLYTLIDDTAGFGYALRPSRDRNLAIASFGTSEPPDLHGSMVNGMEAFGCANQLGADGACWKGNGLACVDGVLHLSISRHWYHRKEFDHRQIARDASILHSSDHGLTWNRAPWNAQALPDPLFPGARFATPFFCDVGRDGRVADGGPAGLDRWVYAVSTDGYWNNGNALHLARVEHARLGEDALEAWEFFCGRRGGEPVWRPGKAGLEACFPILEGAFHFGQTGMTWLPELGRFILIGWRYPELSRDSWQHRTAVWDVFESPTPWGPWTCIGSRTWEHEGFYNPCLPTRFLSTDNRSGWLLTCGDFNTAKEPAETTLYSLYALPFELMTT